jgi:uncharacterized membrane protein
MERNIRSRLFGVNVPRSERIVSAIGGAAAIAVGLRTSFAGRPLGGALLAVAGAAALARAATGRCPAYRARSMRKGIQIRRAVTVQSSPREIYELWRDFENLPRFLKHVSQVTHERAGISRWVAHAGRRRLEWTVELVEDVPARRLRWRSLPGGDVRCEGALDLREAPGDRGTVVEIKLHWQPPGGVLVAASFHELLLKLASAEIGRDLARFQQLIETGEIATGARRLDQLRDDPGVLAASITGGRTRTATGAPPPGAEPRPPGSTGSTSPAGRPPRDPQPGVPGGAGGGAR